VLHALLLALILPVTAILVVGAIELLAKDEPEDDTPEWVRPLSGPAKEAQAPVSSPTARWPPRQPCDETHIPLAGRCDRFQE
jgi:hypothetical protein